MIEVGATFNGFARTKVTEPRFAALAFIRTGSGQFGVNATIDAQREGMNGELVP